MIVIDNFFKTASWADVASATPWPARPPSVIVDDWVYFSSIDMAFPVGDIQSGIENDLSQALDDAVSSGDYVRAGAAQTDLLILSLCCPPH
ncbi:MAG: hypothetical protein M0Q95_21235 [Porticoccaceae bacterium]|nr:hypothetical protein [Porticoccaceae bacterium]